MRCAFWNANPPSTSWLFFPAHEVVLAGNVPGNAGGSDASDGAFELSAAAAVAAPDPFGLSGAGVGTFVAGLVVNGTPSAPPPPPQPFRAALQSSNDQKHNDAG